MLDEIRLSESIWNRQQVSLLRGILGRLMIRPVVQGRLQPLHIENGFHFGVLSEALHLFRNMISLPRQPGVPVSGLSAALLLVEYYWRKPTFQGSPDQPTITPSAQILI